MDEELPRMNALTEEEVISILKSPPLIRNNILK